MCFYREDTETKRVYLLGKGPMDPFSVTVDDSV